MVVSGGLVSGFAVDQQSTICRFYRCLSCLVAVWPGPAGALGGFGGAKPPHGDAAGTILGICLGIPPRLGRDKIES